MISTNDKLLMECCPSNIDWDVYMRDCEKAVNISELHSDEWSTEDEGLANAEVEQKKRPERLTNTNSVIVIREKKWRSSNVCKCVKLFLIILYLYIITYIFLLDQKNFNSSRGNWRKYRNWSQSCTLPSN